VPLKINQVWWLLGFLATSSVEFRCATQVLSCAQPKHQAGWSHPRAHPEVEGRLGLAVAVVGRSLTFMSTPLRPFPTSPTSSRTEMRCETKKLTMIWMVLVKPWGAPWCPKCYIMLLPILRPSETIWDLCHGFWAFEPYPSDFSAWSASQILSLRVWRSSENAGRWPNLGGLRGPDPTTTGKASASSDDLSMERILK
jgi:thiol-disulfide isomerase/thioredoxin